MFQLLDKEDDDLIIKTFLGGIYVLTQVGTMFSMNYWKGTQGIRCFVHKNKKDDPTYIHFII